MRLVYDTETDGICDHKLSDDHPSQPHLVQLGAKLVDDAGVTKMRVSLIVKPDGWIIPDGAARVHGITTEFATKYGLPRRVVLATFTQMRAVANRIVCHNLVFDEKVMACQIAQEGITPAHPGPTQRLCTLEISAPIVNLPPTARMKAAGFDKPKPPKLEEAYKFFFNEDLVGAHDALIDADACDRVFQHLMTHHIDRIPRPAA